MDKLIDQYISLVFTYQELQVEDILNRFIRSLNPQDIQLISGKTPLFLHTANSIRNSSPNLQDYVKKDLISRGLLV